MADKLPEFAQDAVEKFRAVLKILTTHDRILALREVGYCDRCGKINEECECL